MLTESIRLAFRWSFNKFHIRKNFVSVTMNSGTKMLFFLAAVSAEEFITMRLQDIADKYRHQSYGNGEFSTWIEKVYYAAKRPKGNMPEKARTLYEFLAYDTQRQYLEDRITDRINTIESLLPNRKLSQICVTAYLAQKSRLSKAFKFTNAEKQRLIESNSEQCTEKDEPKWQPPPPPPKKRPPPPSSESGESYDLEELFTDYTPHNYDWYYKWWWG